MSNVTKVSVKIGEHELVFETGKIAKQANGAVYAHYCGSAVIATACCGINIMHIFIFEPD